MNRRIAVVLVAGILAVSGCSTDSEQVQEDTPTAPTDGCAPGGEQVESIVVMGAFGDLPEVTIEGPLVVEQTQRAVVIEGDGVGVDDGDYLMIDYALYNGSNGEKIEDSGFDESSPSIMRLDTSTLLPGISLTVGCSKVGSRVVGLIPASDAFGVEGAPEFGLNPGDSLVFLVDIVSILDRIEGEPAEPSEGFPRVSYAESGEPTVTIPEGDVPSEFAVDVVIEGSGALVDSDSEVVVHYHGVNWNTTNVFDSSWRRGQPASFLISGVVAGFREGLVGQKVGSRVIIVIPAELGYGPMGGTQDGSIGPTDTIVFVVDILGATQP